MVETVNINDLIEKFRDMADRGTLLTGANVSQEDLFLQITGTIAVVAMNAAKKEGN